jgi:hypothetical protein
MDEAAAVRVGRELAAGREHGRLWAEAVSEDAIRRRFAESAIIDGWPDSPTDARDAALRLSSGILDTRPSDAKAEEFWRKAGVEVVKISDWFLKGFIRGAVSVFDEWIDREIDRLERNSGRT